MSIEGLIDQTVMEHLSMFGCVKNMDPFAVHMLKTSEHPLMRFRRDWMRREALKQCLEATQHQTKLNTDLASHPHPKGMNGRLNASISPWFVGDMAKRHNASWNDPDFQGYVKREEPSIFPKRDG
jgi:hypothetical protein